MGNALSSPAKPDITTKSSTSGVSGSSSKLNHSNTACLLPLNWSVASTDPLSRSEVLNPSAFDLSLYPLDGRPEHGQFTNHLQLKLHYYIWYPPCCSSDSNSTTSTCYCNSGNSNEEEAPVACPQSAEGSPADFGFATDQQHKQQQPQQELCIHCKRARVRYSRGVVLLLHGYQSHARFSWLRRWAPPVPVNRDPRVNGYILHEELAEQKARETKETQETGEKGTGQREDADGEKENTTGILTAEAEDAACGTCAGCAGTPQYSGSIVETLNKLGFVVAALDAESHGLSEGWEGRRGGIRDAEDLVDDAMQFIHVIRRRLWVLKNEEETGRGETEGEKKQTSGTEKWDMDAGQPQTQDTEKREMQGETGEMQETEKRETEGEAKATQETEERDAEGDTAGQEETDQIHILGETELPVFLIGSSLGGWTAARCAEKFRDSQTIARALPAVAAAVATAGAGAASGETSKNKGGDDKLVAAAAPCLRLRGLVLLSAMFDVESAKGGARWRYTRPLLQQLAIWTPHMHVSKNTLDSRYKSEVEHRKKDLLYIKHGSRARTAVEVLGKADLPIQPKEAKKIEEASCNAVLVAHNALDEQCGIKGALEFYKQIMVTDKRFLAINAVPPEVSRETKDERGKRKAEDQCVFHKRISPELQEELQRCADVALAGLDVHHSFASEVDGNVVLGKVAEWVQKHSN